MPRRSAKLSVLSSPLSVPAWATIAWPSSAYRGSGCTPSRALALKLLRFLQFETWNNSALARPASVIKDRVWENFNLWCYDVVPEEYEEKGGDPKVVRSVVDACSGFYCPAGTFSPAIGQDCMPCSRGTYAPVEGRTACEQCPEGHEADDNHQNCLPCKPGFYLHTATMRCLQCPENETTWSRLADEALASVGLSTCNCKVGYYRSFANDSEVRGHCLPCPEGAVCNGNDTQPWNEEAFYDFHLLQDEALRDELLNAGNMISYCSYGPSLCLPFSNESVCRAGYDNGSLWCSGCLPGFVSVDRQCKTCSISADVADYILSNTGNFFAISFILLFMWRRSSGSGSHLAYVMTRVLEFLPVLTTHFQLLTVVVDLEFQWTSSLFAVSSAVRVLAGMAWVNLENFRLACHLEWLTWEVTSMLYALLFPVTVAFIGLSFLVNRVSFKGGSPPSSRCSRLVYNMTAGMRSWSDVRAKALAFGSIFYLPVSYRAITTLIYTRLERSDVTVLQARPSSFYFVGNQYSSTVYPAVAGVLALATLTLPVLGLGIWKVIDERRHKQIFSTSAVSGRFRPGLSVWHVIELSHKLLLASFAQLPDATTKAFLIVLIESITLVLLVRVRPYDSPYLNRSATVFEGVVLLQLLLTLAFVDTNALGQGVDAAALATALNVLILGAHVLSIMVFLFSVVLQSLRHSHRYALRASMKDLQTRTDHLVEVAAEQSEGAQSTRQRKNTSSWMTAQEETLMGIIVSINSFKGYMFSTPSVHNRVVAFLDEKVLENSEQKFIALLFAHVLSVHEARRNSSSWIAATVDPTLRWTRFGLYKDKQRPEHLLPCVSEVFTPKALRVLCKVMVNENSRQELDVLRRMLVTFARVEKTLQATEARRRASSWGDNLARDGSVSDFFDERLVPAFADTLQFYYLDDEDDSVILGDQYRMIVSDCFRALLEDVGLRLDEASAGFASRHLSMVKYVSVLRDRSKTVQSPMFGSVLRKLQMPPPPPPSSEGKAAVQSRLQPSKTVDHATRQRRGKSHSPVVSRDIELQSFRRPTVDSLFQQEQSEVVPGREGPEP